MNELVAGATAKLDAHIWEREENEHYVEPSWVSSRLLDEEKFDGPIDDPCCGFGTIPLNAIARGLEATAGDIVYRGFSCDVTDFLESGWARVNIICNPPLNIADKFALHALEVATRKVAIVFPVAHLNAAHWLIGTPLETVWLMTPRPSMPPGHVIASGKKPGGGKMDYCWLVWRKGFDGTPVLKWLRRDGERKVA
jgi:hypothetical protein